MGEAAYGNPRRGQNRETKSPRWSLVSRDLQRPLMTSSGTIKRTTETPSAQPNGALDSGPLCDAIDALLLAHPASRTVLRHLTYFAAAFRKTGPAVFETLRLDVLKQALLQLHLAAGDNPPAAIRPLVRQMEASIARRDGPAARPVRRDNQPSDLMNDDRMQVSEGRMSDFVRLAEKNRQV